LRTGNAGDNGRDKSKITFYILELKKSFIRYMLEIPNITLTAFLIAFGIALVLSIIEKNYPSAIGCFLTIATILPIKYMVWRKQVQVENKKQKVIVIKRK
jgi:hypothetical protein